MFARRPLTRLGRSLEQRSRLSRVLGKRHIASTSSAPADDDAYRSMLSDVRLQKNSHEKRLSRTVHVWLGDRSDPPAEFSYTWLREFCPCKECLDPSTGQRRTRASPVLDHGVDRDTELSVQAIDKANDALHITWKDGHQSTYAHEYLATYKSWRTVARYRTSPPPRFLWNKVTLARTHFAWPLSPAGRAQAMANLLKYGVTFLSDVPQNGEAIEDVAKAFGDIRDTFYGRTWDVRSVPNSTNVAYTDQDLGFHQDLLYMRVPPAYQVLHCVENEVSGGESALVDGVYAAYKLGEREPSLFSLLANFPVPFQYVNAGQRRFCSHPTFEVVYDGAGADGVWQHRPLMYGAPSDFPRPTVPPHIPLPWMRFRTIARINYSPPFQAPIAGGMLPDRLLDALREYQETLNDSLLVYKYKMRPGDAVVFDNRRVLHARTAFDANEGSRWLKGCYLDEDSVVDTWRHLEEESLSAGAPRSPLVETLMELLEGGPQKQLSSPESEGVVDTLPRTS